MTKEVKSLWGCIIVLFSCVLVLGCVLLFRLIDRSDVGTIRLPGGGSSVVASVGSDQITESQWVDELKKQYGSIVMEQMLNKRAVDQEAQALDVQVTSKEVEAEIRKQMAGYESMEAYYLAMQEQLGLTPEQIREDATYNLLLEKIAIRDISVTEEEISQYLKENRQEYHPVAYELSHIVVDTFKDAEQALKRLGEGISFGALAGQISTDPYTVEQEGKLGWVEDDDPFIDSNELAAAAAMEVGDYSRPIKVKDGYAIILLSGRRDVEPEDRMTIREQVSRDLALSKAPPLREVEKQLRDKYAAQWKSTHS
ncbi:peptidyl-prolyl cis-trans isomerase [Paenibacillus arenosi]|uniref:peptidylprolyl isomerase n=1 Tax=Paenibacillus arenosi TaxID=2774142 RepID=A0ABR9B697_9BACL|nr:peptidyl-prolyl cis-trans isomerase [Paenibacillus arenosi]MBD8500706.1 peptidyl-prolyl cis-trans isomerase [Paenibacillus arenosi]